MDDWQNWPVANADVGSDEPWKSWPVAGAGQQPGLKVAQEDDQSGVEPPHTGFFSGIADAAAAGVKSDAASLSVIPDALKGKVAAEPPAQPKPFEAPLAWEDIYKDPALAAQKITFQLAGSGSILAGGYAGARVGAPLGAVIGTGIGMLGGPAAPATAPIGAGLGSAIGAVAGSAVGAAAVGGLKSLKPYLAEELAKPDVDPADAYKTALLRATQEGAFTGAGWALFHAGAASGPLMHIALQAFGIQPGVHIAKTGIENLEQGKPLTEGMAEGLPSAVVGTAVPLAGFAAIHAAGPSKPAITTPLKTAFQDMATQTDNIQREPSIPTPDANASDTQARDALNAAVSPTTPEPTADIAAQVAAVADHTNPKGAVFVAAGNEASIPPTLPEGMVRVNRPEGTLLTNNPDKATAFKTGPMDDAKIAELLNYTEPKADAIASGDPRIVQGQDANGNVVRDEVVSPQNVPDAIAAASAETPGGTAGEVPVEDALARRNQDDPLPTTLDSFNPDQIGVDAQRFQFKGGGDENGVTDRLQGVKQWDPLLGGVGLVWQDASGKNWIADGHQRLALAKRMQADGQEGVALNAHVLKETDGVTAADARYLAAAKNVAEGTGTPLDAAKMFRESRALGLKIPELPPRSALARDGFDMARLSDEAFGFAINRLVPENQAAVVGRLIADPLQQTEAMRILTMAKPDNARQAEMIVRDMLSTGTTKAEKYSLFGAENFASSIVLERAQIIDDALNLIKKDKSVFNLLVKDAERIQAHGENSLDTDANKNRLTTDEQTTDTLANLATHHGPVSEALTVLARQLKDKTINRADASRSFLENVRRETQAPVAVGDKLRGAGHGDENPGAEPPVEGQGGFFSRRDDRQPLLSDKLGLERAGQGVIPGAEASAKQAIQARDEAALRSKVPQKSMDDLGLFSSGNKQGSLFSTRDTVKSETHAQDAADARTATPEAQAARVRLYNLVQATMRYMGLPEDVGLRFVDRLLDEHGGEADGAYANRILTMALDTAPAEMPLRVTHEIIHAIRMLNPEIKLLTSGQMRALESGAKAWLKDRSVDDRTKTNAEYLADIGYDQSHMVEEGIARIGERALARAVQPGMAQTYGRITNFLTGIGRMMRGEGYTSADDVFRSLFQGDKASTEARTGLDNALMGRTAPPVSPAVPSTGDDVVDAINHARANQPDTYFSRRDDRVPLFSPVARAVDSLRQTKGTGEQFLAQISKMPGVKPEELKWMGIGDWLRGQKSVTKEQVADYVRANSLDVREVMKGGQADADKKMISSLFAQYYERTGTPGLVAGRETPEFLASSENAERLRLIAEEPGLSWSRIAGEPGPRATKYEQWKLPGGENYRELLLTLPPKEDFPPGFSAIQKDGGWGVRFPDGSEIGGWRTREDAVRSQLSQAYSPQYRSSHWQEPNVLAHVRFDDRTAPDGKKVLMVHEIQSDWHQAGRQNGYGDGGVPDAPFKTSWPTLAMKRVVKYAADNGYDRVAWSPGEVHADRYDLSMQVDRINYAKRADGLYDIEADQYSPNLARQKLPTQHKM